MNCRNTSRLEIARASVWPCRSTAPVFAGSARPAVLPASPAPALSARPRPAYLRRRHVHARLRMLSRLLRFPGNDSCRPSTLRHRGACDRAAYLASILQRRSAACISSIGLVLGSAITGMLVPAEPAHILHVGSASRQRSSPASTCTDRRSACLPANAPLSRCLVMQSLALACPAAQVLGRRHLPRRLGSMP